MRVSVIGSSNASESERGNALEVGRVIGERGHVVVCGGLGGVMRSVCQGVNEAGGEAIGLLPGEDRRSANEYVDTVVVTGLGNARNALVVLNGDGVIAVGGSTGTLSEIGHALDYGKPVAGIDSWGIDGVRDVDSGVEAVDYLEQELMDA